MLSSPYSAASADIWASTIPILASASISVLKMLASKTNKVLAVMDTRGSNRTSMINVW